MQIGSPELLIVLIILAVVFGLYGARPAASAGSPAYRNRRRAGTGSHNTETAGAGSARSEDPTPAPAAAGNPYAVLNLSPDATRDEVTAAYRKLAQMYHPDKVAGLAPEYQEIAEKKMKEINAAYEQLRP